MLSLPRPRFGNCLTLKFWSDRGITREDLHRELVRKAATADQSSETDFLLSRGPLFRTSLITATEYHEKKGRLTRARLLFRLNTTVFLACLGLALAASVFLGKSWWPPLALGAWTILEWWGKAYAGCGLVCKAARRCGLDQMD
jgi:hypothetical protein